MNQEKSFNEILTKNEKRKKKLRNIRWTLYQNDETRKISSEALTKHFESLDYVQSTVFQLEKGNQENKLHYQGYSQFNCQKRFYQIIKDFKGAYILPAYASYKKNKEYCTKDETRIEGPFFSGVPKIGQNKSLIDVDERALDIIGRIKNNETYEQLLLAYPNWAMNHESLISQLIGRYAPINSINRKVTCLYGSSKAGKTITAKKWAYSKYPKSKVCTKSTTTKNGKQLWFLEEDRHKEVLILEEIRIGHPDLYDLLNLLKPDSSIAIKGKLAPNPFKEIILCFTNDNPWMTYSDYPVLDDQVQLLRRFQHCWEIIPNNVQLDELSSKELTEDDLIEQYEPFIFNRDKEFQKYSADLSEAVTCTISKICKLNVEYWNILNEIYTPERDKTLLAIEKNVRDFCSKASKYSTLPNSEYQMLNTLLYEKRYIDFKNAYQHPSSEYIYINAWEFCPHPKLFPNYDPSKLIPPIKLHSDVSKSAICKFCKGLCTMTGSWKFPKELIIINN